MAHFNANKYLLTELLYLGVIVLIMNRLIGTQVITDPASQYGLVLKNVGWLVGKIKGVITLLSNRVDQDPSRHNSLLLGGLEWSINWQQ